jgi:hypothetical protein
MDDQRQRRTVMANVTGLKRVDPNLALSLGVVQPAPSAVLSEIVGPKEIAVVARGRTIMGSVPGQVKFVGHDREGNKVYGPIYRVFGPGQEIELPVAECQRLRGLGFLVDQAAIGELKS